MKNLRWLLIFLLMGCQSACSNRTDAELQADSTAEFEIQSDGTCCPDLDTDLSYPELTPLDDVASLDEVDSIEDEVGELLPDVQDVCIPLDPVGTYQVTLSWDFSEAWPDMSEWFESLFDDHLADRTLILVEMASSLQLLMGGVDEADKTALFQDLQEAFANWTASHEPQFSTDLKAADIILLENPEVVRFHHLLEITPGENIWTYPGNLTFSGVTLTWAENCPAPGEPGWTEDCGVYSFSAADLDAVAQEWFGVALNLDSTHWYLESACESLLLDGVAMKVNLSKLRLLMDLALLPQVSTSIHVDQVATDFVDCSAIAASMDAALIAAAGLSLQDVESTCAEARLMVVQGLLSNFEIGSEIRLHGKLTPSPSEADPTLAGELVGEFWGTFQLNNQTQSEFTGTLEGERLE